MTDYSNNTYEASIASNFIRSVYSYMFIAMAISGVIAYAVGTCLLYTSDAADE